MKLYIHDEKHDHIISSLDLGEISGEDNTRLQEVIEFLDRNSITTRYKRLVLAKGHTEKYVEGECEIEFYY